MSIPRSIIGALVAGAFVAMPFVAPAAPTINYQVHNRYGGPSYNGQPALAATAALVKAGGGAAHFSIATALTSMVGAATVKAEMAKLTKQYGKTEVTRFVTGFNFAVQDAAKHVVAAKIKLPKPPANLVGKKLATALVTAGVDPKTGVFWSGLMYDVALSHHIHNQTMDDIDAKYGQATDMAAHRVTNQAMYDLAHALGHSNVKLASLH